MVWVGAISYWNEVRLTSGIHEPVNQQTISVF